MTVMMFFPPFGSASVESRTGVGVPRGEYIHTLDES